MANEAIANWLNDPNKNYQSGVRLFCEFSDNELGKVKFTKGQSDWHFNKLVEELKALNNFTFVIKPKPVQIGAFVELPGKIPTRVTEISAIAIPKLEDIPLLDKRHSATDTEWEKLPEEIKDLYGNSSRLHSRSLTLFTSLRVATSDEQRLMLALQMLDDRDLINKNRDAIREYNDKGNVPAPVIPDEIIDVSTLSITEVVKLAKNLPTYISKDNKRYADMQPGKKRDKVSVRITANTNTLIAVKKRLADG